MVPALACGILWGSVSTVLWPGLVCLALAALGWFLTEPSRRLGWTLLLTLSVGMLLGQIAYHPTLPEEGTYEITGVVTDEVVQRDTLQIHTTLSQLTLNGKAVSGSAYWSFYQEELPEGLAPGCRVSFTASLYHPGGATNPGGFDFRAYLLQHGIRFGLYGGNDALTIESGTFSLDGWIASLRHALLLRLREVMGEDAGNYAGTMLLGVKSLIPDDERAAFNALGIGHILSVSGFHVGLLYAALCWLLQLLRVPLRFHPIPVAVLLIFYCMLTGGNAPVIRASLLCMLVLLGRCQGRTRNRFHLLCVSALLQLAISPVQLTSAGFQLSYGAMLGLVLITPRLQRADPFRYAYHKQMRKLGGKAWAMLAAALGAQLGVLLPELYWYQELPVLGLICNLLTLTLASALLTAYWLCLAVMFLPGIGPFVGNLVAGLNRLIVTVVQGLGSQDWLLLWTKQANAFTAASCLLLFVGGCCLWHRFRRSQALCLSLGCAVLVLSLIVCPTGQVTYTQLDVNAADAAVLNDRGTITVIDTGEDSTLSTYLHQRRLGIDNLVLTHLHSDHAGGIQDLLEDHIPVARCYLPDGAENAGFDAGMLELLEQLEARGTELIHLSRGDVLSTGSGTLTVLWPESDVERPWNDTNDGSLVLQASLRGTTLLLTGDITSNYELYSAVPSDILKAAHHGSSGSTSVAFLEAVDPQVILLSCGPESRTASFQERVGSYPVFSTANQGALTLSFEEGAYTVSPYLKSSEDGQ